MKKVKSSPSNTESTQINNFQNKINQTTARYIIVKLKKIRIRRKILKPGRGCIKKQIHEVRNPEFVRMATLRREWNEREFFKKFFSGSVVLFLSLNIWNLLVQFLLILSLLSNLSKTEVIQEMKYSCICECQVMSTENGRFKIWGKL